MELRELKQQDKDLQETGEDERLVLLRRISESERRMEKYMRHQYVLSILSVCLSVLLICGLAAGGVLLNRRLKRTAERVNQISEKATVLMERVNRLTEDLDLAKLKEMDIQALNKGVRELGDAAKNLGKVDMSNINGAIGELKETLDKVNDLNLDSLAKSLERLMNAFDSFLSIFTGD